jgi:hypothetical protein
VQVEGVILFVDFLALIGFMYLIAFAGIFEPDSVFSFAGSRIRCATLAVGLEPVISMISHLVCHGSTQ